MAIPSVKLTQGIHVLHLFFRVDRVRWAALPAGESAATLDRLDALAKKYPGPAAPRISTYAGVGGKADIGFMIYAAELQQLSAMQREVELAFPAGTLQPVYSYLSVTEL
ncbi:MAG: hypothetical protein RLZZ265_4017, partial [Verrucomicrobiota bacterium]